MSARSATAVMVCAAALLASACGGISSPSANTIDTFNAILNPGGSNIHPFSVGNLGEVTVTITKESPTTNVALGIFVSQLAGGLCDTNTPYFNRFALLNQTALSIPQLAKGSYCVDVYDVGDGHVPSPITYTIEVRHP